MSLLRLVTLSDTHLERVDVPEGDILIHAGDHTYRGTEGESKWALSWLSALPHKHKIIIAGNHEVGWQKTTKRYFILKQFLNLTYLHNSAVTIEGIKFWGSPIQPCFHGWAFQLPRGPMLKSHWDSIPEDTDVLITHGPPYGLGDTNTRDERFGDEDLLTRVLAVKPMYHIYGHAHHGYGIRHFEGVTFVNSAILNDGYQVANKPHVLDIDLKDIKIANTR